MPTARKTSTAKKVSKPVAVETSPKNSKSIVSSIKSFKPTRTTYIALVLIGLLVLAYYKKGWFIAATVNGSPITNFEVLSKLNQQYRTQTLNQMVNEKIINSEIQKSGVVISNADVDSKIAQIEANVGGAQALDGLLAQQGQTRQSLRDQLKIQLAIEKLYDKDASVSADEVKQFIEQNKDQLQASDSAGQVKEATDILKQQKIGQIFNQKFQELKSAAKVQIF